MDSDAVEKIKSFLFIGSPDVEEQPNDMAINNAIKICVALKRYNINPHVYRHCEGGVSILLNNKPTLDIDCYNSGLILGAYHHFSPAKPFIFYIDIGQIIICECEPGYVCDKCEMNERNKVFKINLDNI